MTEMSKVHVRPTTKSPRVLAREKRDEALRKLGEATYRGWVAAGRQQGALFSDELNEADRAVMAVALQA